MSLTKRIIPCLDVKDGRTVKGVNFVGLRDVGDPVELAARYAQEGADELVFLDITATHEKRKTLVQLVSRVAAAINIPFTVGGGISSVEDAQAVLEAGADKVSINSAAVKRPQFINELSERFGAQFVVLAIDAKRESDSSWRVHTHGGRNATDLELFSWAEEGATRGAGEILFTSMDHDGTRAGFANEALAKLHALLTIPVIASGGGGQAEHFVDVFRLGKADAALAASIFHEASLPVPKLKAYLQAQGLNIRPHTS